MIHGRVEQIPTPDICKRQRAVAAGTSTSRGSGWFGFCILGLAFLAAPLLPGQEAQPAVMAGTKLRVQFDSEVGTAISRVNDGVEVHLLKPVEAQGREVLPVGTVLSARVLAVRKGDAHKKIVPMLRLAFEQVRLPDGRTFPVKASLANLGVSESVDSEGAAMPTPNTKSGNVGAAAGAAGVGAGVGAIAGGGSGAAKGAGVGAGIGILGDLLTRNSGYWDFTLNRGRKAWLRLDDDLSLAPPPFTMADGADTQGPSPVAQSPFRPANPPGGPAPPKPENKQVNAQLTAPVATAPASPKPENKGLVYVEPAPKARFNRVDTEALLRDLNKAGVPLTVNPSQADYLLHSSHDNHRFHAELTDRNGRIVWAGLAATEGGLRRGIVRYMREHAPLKSEP